MSINTSKLSEMLRSKRGDKGLRSIANEIGGVSASTLSRIELGNLPDIDTFFKLCEWLEVKPDFFTNGAEEEKDTKTKIIAHLRADATLPEATSKALIEMIKLAYDSALNGEIKIKK